jgi:hypothetical protein
MEVGLASFRSPFTRGLTEADPSCRRAAGDREISQLERRAVGACPSRPRTAVVGSPASAILDVLSEHLSSAVWAAKARSAPAGWFESAAAISAKTHSFRRSAKRVLLSLTETMRKSTPRRRQTTPALGPPLPADGVVAQQGRQLSRRNVSRSADRISTAPRRRTGKTRGRTSSRECDGETEDNLDQSSCAARAIAKGEREARDDNDDDGDDFCDRPSIDRGSAEAALPTACSILPPAQDLS